MNYPPATALIKGLGIGALGERTRSKKLCFRSE